MRMVVMCVCVCVWACVQYSVMLGGGEKRKKCTKSEWGKDDSFIIQKQWADCYCLMCRMMMVQVAVYF